MIEIAKMLKDRGLRSKVLREEYLDHYASQFESLRKSGVRRHHALATIAVEIQEMDIKKAHQAYFDLHFKKPIMMTTTFLFIITVFFTLPNNSSTTLSEHNCNGELTYLAAATYDDPPSINPVSDKYLDVYSGFGMRMHPVFKKKKFHSGVDIRASIGTPVVAPSDGVITKTGYHSKKGNYIEIKHDDIYSTRYYHLSKIDVKTNQQITRGSKIGEIGTSGASTAPHLHYEVVKDGRNVDPGDYLKV